MAVRRDHHAVTRRIESHYTLRTLTVCRLLGPNRKDETGVRRQVRRSVFSPCNQGERSDVFCSARLLRTLGMTPGSWIQSGRSRNEMAHGMRPREPDSEEAVDAPIEIQTTVITASVSDRISFDDLLASSSVASQPYTLESKSWM